MDSIIYEVENPEKRIIDLKQQASENGLEVTGDYKSGEITGMGIKGNFNVEGNKITFNIIDKPFFISESKIKSILDGFMGS
jgi:hypothetical protein